MNPKFHHVVGLGHDLGYDDYRIAIVHAMDSEDESEFENDEFNEGQNEDSGYAILGLLYGRQ